MLNMDNEKRVIAWKNYDTIFNGINYDDIEKAISFNKDFSEKLLENIHKDETSTLIIPKNNKSMNFENFSVNLLGKEIKTTSIKYNSKK